MNDKALSNTRFESSYIKENATVFLVETAQKISKQIDIIYYSIFILKYFQIKILIL